MDTELSWQIHATMIITSDQEKHWLEALTREQDCAYNEAVKQVQTQHLREVEVTTDASCCSFKCRSTSQEEDFMQTWEESPEYGTTPWKRGRSLQQKPDKHKADQSPALPSKRRPGSRSYTPCERPCTLYNRSQSRHCSSSRCHAHSRHRYQSRHAAAVPHLTMTVLVTVTLHPGNGRWTPNQDQYNQCLCSTP